MTAKEEKSVVGRRRAVMMAGDVIPGLELGDFSGANYICRDQAERTSTPS